MPLVSKSGVKEGHPPSAPVRAAHPRAGLARSPKLAIRPSAPWMTAVGSSPFATRMPSAELISCAASSSTATERTSARPHAPIPSTSSGGGEAGPERSAQFSEDMDCSTSLW